MSHPDDPLPQQTADDTDVGWNEDPVEDDLKRLRDERPPHHLDGE